MKRKKLLSAVLAATLAASMMLAGCGSNDSTQSSAPESSPAPSSQTESASASPDASQPAADEIEKPEKITIMVDGTVPTKPNGQAEFFAKLTELTGIEYEIIQPDHDAYFDVVGQTIAGGEWPDVIILSSTYYSGYASEGVLWDMTDAWENSELKQRQIACNGDGAVEGVKINGTLYGMPDGRGGGCVTYVKKAWLDNCGLSIPTNYEEYLAMLVAFTEGDPDGDGVNGNTYGVSAAGFCGNEAPYTNYLPEFYQDGYPSFYQKEDGTWVDGFTEDSMKAALERLADAYSKGVIDPTTLNNGTKDCRNKFYSNEFGVFTYWAGTWATNLKTNLEANNVDSELVALPPIKELAAAGGYFDRIPPVWCITTQCENPEGVFKYFIEPMQDGGEIEYLWSYGVEDVHWSTKEETLYEGTDNEKKYAEGEWHFKDNMETPGTQYTKAHMDQMGALVKIEEPPVSPAEEAEASQSVFSASCITAPLAPSTDEMSEYNGDLTSLKKEIIAKVTMGEMTVEEGYAKFEADGGAEWSRLIMDSLNNQ